MPFPKPYTKANITSGYLTAHRPNHTGIDMSKGKGTVIYPIWAGKVIGMNEGCREGETKCGGGYGNYVKIWHPNGLYSFYGHLESVSKLPANFEVDTNTPIGTEGNTGQSEGAHLHFEIQNAQGQPIDPMPYLKGAVGADDKPKATGLFAFMSLTPLQLITGVAIFAVVIFLLFNNSKKNNYG